MQRRNLVRLSIAAAGVAVLAAVHGGALYVAWTHLGLSSATVAAIVLAGLLKHLGLLSPFYLLSKWRSRSDD
jgi:hypothetical protein